MTHNPREVIDEFREAQCKAFTDTDVNCHMPDTLSDRELLLSSRTSPIADVAEELLSLVELRFLICDECGRIHADTETAMAESCACGGFTQRMEWATSQQVTTALAERDRLAERVKELEGDALLGKFLREAITALSDADYDPDKNRDDAINGFVAAHIRLRSENEKLKLQVQCLTKPKDA